MMSYYRGSYDSFRAGSLEAAREYQLRANRILSARPDYPGIPLAKAMVEAMSFPVGNATFPMRRLTEEKVYALRRMVEAGLEL